MIDIVYRYVPGYRRERPAPASHDEARRRLEEGNRAFASVLVEDTGAARAPLVMTFDLSELGG